MRSSASDKRCLSKKRGADASSGLPDDRRADKLDCVAKVSNQSCRDLYRTQIFDLHDPEVDERVTKADGMQLAWRSSEIRRSNVNAERHARGRLQHCLIE